MFWCLDSKLFVFGKSNIGEFQAHKPWVCGKKIILEMSSFLGNSSNIQAEVVGASNDHK